MRHLVQRHWQPSLPVVRALLLQSLGLPRRRLIQIRLGHRFQKLQIALPELHILGADFAHGRIPRGVRGGNRVLPKNRGPVTYWIAAAPKQLVREALDESEMPHHPQRMASAILRRKRQWSVLNGFER